MPLTDEQQRLLGIVAAAMVAWLTEVLPIPVTALLIAPALIAAGITDAKTAFAHYADPILFLFYGSFFIAAAMHRHGLDARIAHNLVSLPVIRGIPGRTRAALMAAGMLLSMWISNTAASAILVPILLGAVVSNGDQRSERVTIGGLLAIAYACSAGGMGTLVGTPPNLITVRLLKETGVAIGFLPWMAFGVPCALVCTVVVYLMLARALPAGAVAVRPASASLRVGVPWSRGELVTALCFAAAVLGWVVPGALKAMGVPGAEPLGRALPSGAVAIWAAAPLFLLSGGSDGERVLPWREALGVDWGLIMLFGGGLALGSQMFETGLADALGRGFLEVTGVRDIWTLTALAVAFTILFTEVCSNTATANMLVPLVIGVSRELGASAVPAALAVGISASCAFMMPIATGPNAIAYGTGRVPLTRMVRTGFVLNLLCGVAVFVLIRVLSPLYGWVD